MRSSIYRLTISNSNITKEISLSPDADCVRIGTEYGVDFRCYQEDFIDAFELMMQFENDIWTVTCLQNTFISLGDAKKVINMELRHGMKFDVCSQISGANLFHAGFSYDFDWEEKRYDGLINLANIPKFVIGTSRNCDIVLLDDLGTNEMIEIRNMGNCLEATICTTEFGFWINGRNVNQNSRIMDTDFFSIAHFSFYYRKGQLFLANSSHIMVRNLNFQRISESIGGLDYPKFNLNPHLKTIIPNDDIQILDPPAPPYKEESSLWTSLLPSVAMIVLVIVVRGFMGSSAGVGYILFSVCSMSIGIITSVTSFFKGKKKHQKSIDDRKSSYEEYIQNKMREIKQARELEASLLNKEFPDERASMAMVINFSGELFDRTDANGDFLKVRLGQGVLPAARRISYAPKEKIIPGDELEMLPAGIAQKNRNVENVPIICNLLEVHNLGIVGSEERRYSFLKLFVMDLCVHHYYASVQTFFIFKQERSRQMEWVKMLPHVQNNGRNIRNIICDEESQAIQYEFLYKELCFRRNMGEHQNGPWIVVFLVDECGIYKHPISKFFEDAYRYRVHFVFFEDMHEKLPMFCGETVTLTQDNAGQAIINGEKRITQFFFQKVSDEHMYIIGRKLAPVYCEDVSLESTLTRNISLFELLNIYSVEDLDFDSLWKQKDICKTMAAPLGVKSKNEKVYLDLHEAAHGPHGLVAGTTGSGKSELLQTYILSMAVQYSPYEVGFVLIDFKGGGMANQFRNLPHLIGAITDIDGREINRSLLSIRAELDKRKELFARADVNNITQYIQKYRKAEIDVALPHLIIIVDEFAELKAEQPEFMKELISASRIGRSLGVHLILATQKPAGQVSDQIWSNSRFKICLKVQSQSDSNEVIKSPLAAEIKEPGRAYLQVGNNEIFELLQSAYSGGPERKDVGKAKKKFTISRLDLAGRREIIYQPEKEPDKEQARNQLQAIVEKIERYCQESSIEKLPSICLPSLPELLTFPDDVREEAGAQQIQVEIGTYDAPASQYQGPAVLQLAGKNTVIIGSSQYGKTNLLQDIIRMLATKYMPDDVNIYILDFGSMFLKNYEKLPHVGGVVCASEDEKFRNLFKMLRYEVVARKDKMVSTGVSSFVAYREAGHRDMPYIVLIVDNFTAVKETYFENEDELLPICREGTSVGISVIIANPQTAGFGYRYLSTISNQVAFYCNEESEVDNVFGFCRERPDNRPGSCLIQIEKVIYHAQAYLAFEGKREIDRSKDIHDFIEMQTEACKDQKAKQIPQVPDILKRKDAYQFDVNIDVNKAFAIGIDYEDIEIVTLPFEEQFMLALIGEREESKRQFLVTLLTDIKENTFDRNVKLYIVDSITKGLKGYADMPFVERYSTQPEDIIEIVEELYEELDGRLQSVEQDGEMALKEMPVLLLLVNTRKAIEVLGGSKPVMKKFNDISQTYRNLRVMFLFADVENTSSTYSGGDLLKRIRDEKRAIIFDSLKNSKLFDFSLQVIKQKNYPLGRNDAFYLNRDVVRRIKVAEE